MPRNPDPRRGGGDHGVSIPLLLQDPSSSSSSSSASSSSTLRPPPRDFRFAISEDDVDDHFATHDDNDDDVEVQRGSASASRSRSDGHGRSADAAVHNDDDDDDDDDSHAPHSKYPPHDSLPPSYRDAIYVKDPWYRSEVALSLRHYGRECFSGLATLLRRYWPTSRFAQAGFFIIGLWIIVIISGPTWDKSAHLGWGKNVDEFLALIPPSPISGDGHYVSLADWSSPICHNYGLAAYCSRQMSYNLEIPHDRASFFTSDKVFVFVDPPRAAHLSDGRGKVPATVQVKMDGEKAGEAKVDIQAYYEESLEPLLTRAHVGLMKAGLRDQGVGIYTWPLPPNLLNVPKAIYPFPLLSFKVTLHVAPSSRIPNMRIEGSDIDIAVFSDLPKQDVGRHITTRDVTSTVVDKRHGAAGGEGKHSKKSRNNANDGLTLPLLRLGRALGRRQVSASDVPNDPHPLFGSLIAITGHGSLSLGGSIRTTGRLWAENSHGPILVNTAAHLRAHEIHLDAGQGDITVGKASLLESKDEVVVVAHDGDVVVQQGVKILGTRLDGAALQGGFYSPQGIWSSNHTMVLRGSKGIEVEVGVSPPFRPLLGTGTEQRAYVSVEATSEQGNVLLTMSEQVEKTPLRLDAKALQGALTVALNKEYVGEFGLIGGAGSEVVKMTPSTEEGRSRIFELSDDHSSGAAAETPPGHVDAKGQVWWKDATTTAPDKEEETWGRVKAEAKGIAKLSFDA